ncbi:hypothetical protein KCU65_g10165, partial [Aureobasidium melanogenum]
MASSSLPLSPPLIDPRIPYDRNLGFAPEPTTIVSASALVTPSQRHSPLLLLLGLALSSLPSTSGSSYLAPVSDEKFIAERTLWHAQMP